MKDKIIYKNEKLSLTQEQLDKIVEEVYQKNKDDKHYDDEGNDSNYDFMRTESEGELLSLGCDEDWVYSEGFDLIEESLDKVFEDTE